MTPAITLFFVVEPPGYLYMACHLAASIRKFMPPEVRLIGYCPAHRWDEMNPNAVEVLRRLRCEIRPVVTEGRFDPLYPHGNKILAALAPKETDFAVFLDSDMLLMQPCTVEELVSAGQIGMVPSTSMRWAPQTVWQDIYGHFGMAVPDEPDSHDPRSARTGRTLFQRRAVLSSMRPSAPRRGSALPRSGWIARNRWTAIRR